MSSQPDKKPKERIIFYGQAIPTKNVSWECDAWWPPVDNLPALINMHIK